MNFAVFIETLFVILIEDLAKVQVYIGNFGISTAESKKTIKSNIENTTLEADPNDLCTKSTVSSFYINISTRKLQKKPKNAKPKLVKKKFICKPVA